MVVQASKTKEVKMSNEKRVYVDEDLHSRLKASAALAKESLNDHAARVLEAGLKAVKRHD